MTRLRYPQASLLLKRVATQRNLSHSEVVRYYELAGIVAASLGDKAKAREAFRRLHLLQPGFVLKGRFAPKVTTPFFEAKAAAKDDGPMAVRLERASVEGGLVTGVVVLQQGPRGWISEVVVALDEDAVERTVTTRAAASQVVPVRGRRVAASARARDAMGWVLLEVPSTTFEVEAPPVVRATPPQLVPERPTDPPPPPPTVMAVPEASAPRFRPLAITLVAAGGLCLIGGAVASASVVDSRSRFEGALVNGAGVVTGLTRAQALGLEAQAQLAATFATVGFVAGGVLAAAGVTTWFLGNPVQPTVGVLPGGGALFAVEGALP